MKNVMHYNKYYGSVEYNDDDEVFYGEILFINDLVIYEGESVKELKQAFIKAIDDYINTCKLLDKPPEKPFKGSLNIRIGSDLHKKIAIIATQQNDSINNIIKQAIEQFVA